MDCFSEIDRREEADMALVDDMAIAERLGGERDFAPGPVLEIDLLRTLLAIVSTGSFNRAARAVFRTPSAVSMQMKKLEDIVGKPIFAKDGRGVALTADGDELLGFARRMLQLNDEALARFRCQSTEGVVRLGTPDDYATGFLPRILARFAATHPLVQVDVTCKPSSELVDLVDEGEIDVGLMSVGATCGVPNTGDIIHRERLVWAGLRHGQVHTRRPLPIAASGRTCCWRAMATEKLDRAGIPYRIAYSSAHYVGQVAAVLADLAVAPLPKSVLDGDLVAIDDRLLPAPGYYEIQIRTSPLASGAAVEALANHIRQSFETEALASAA
jgi:DNA-binding transcriptional LysR family regulator